MYARKTLSELDSLTVAELQAEFNNCAADNRRRRASENEDYMFEIHDRLPKKKKAEAAATQQHATQKANTEREALERLSRQAANVHPDCHVCKELRAVVKGILAV